MKHPIRPTSLFTRSWSLLLLAALSLSPLLLTAACGTRPTPPATVAVLPSPFESAPPLSSAVDVREVNRALTDSEMEDYTGDAACTSCHKQVAAAQAHSSHAHTFHLVTSHDARVFRTSKIITDTHINYAYHTAVENDKCLMIGKNKSGQEGRIVATYALGTGRTGITYLGEDKLGQWMEMRLSYFPNVHAWDFTPGQPEGRDLVRAAGHPLSPGDFQQCLGCHGTAIRATPEGADVARSLLNVGCERCHGPGRSHIIEAAKALAVTGRVKTLADKGVQTTYGMEDLHRATPARITTICGGCHRTENSQKPLSPTEEPKLARFQGAALARSRCYQQSGTLSCLTCHDAHSNANPSLSRNDAICLRCHSATSMAHTATPSQAAPSAEQATTRTREVAARQQTSSDPPASPPALQNPSVETTPGQMASVQAVAGKVCPVNARTGCTTCHMPKTAGIMPYSLFTNHWIKIWPSSTPSREEKQTNAVK